MKKLISIITVLMVIIFSLGTFCLAGPDPSMKKTNWWSGPGSAGMQPRNTSASNYNEWQGSKAPENNRLLNRDLAAGVLKCKRVMYILRHADNYRLYEQTRTNLRKYLAERCGIQVDIRRRGR